MSNPYTEMQVLRGPGYIVDVSPDPVLLHDTDGTEWLVEWHPWCGPTRLNRKTLDPCRRQPHEKSRFWLIAQWWKDQGGRVDEDGVGIWSTPAIQSHQAITSKGEEVTVHFYEGYEHWGLLAQPPRLRGGSR